MKTTLRLLVTLIILVQAHRSSAQLPPDTVVNLKPLWQVRQDDNYIPFDGRRGRVSSIYMQLPQSLISGKRIAITSSRPFSLFMNSKLVAGDIRSITMSADSVSNLYGNSSGVWMSVYQDKIIYTSLRTWLINNRNLVKQNELVPKPRSFFSDFVILVVLVLLIILVVILQLNAKLTADYFSVIRIFSLRESTDRQSEVRLTDGVNILFYVYASLIVGFFLMIIFRFSPYAFPVSVTFQSHTLVMAVLNWMLLSLLILVALFLKFIVLYAMSWLFAIDDLTNMQFFNWIRLLLITFGTMLMIVFVYAIGHGENSEVYAFFYTLVRWIFVGWVVLIFFKVGSKAEFSKFHIFSYICATEVIPLLITIKVLYY